MCVFSKPKEFEKTLFFYAKVKMKTQIASQKKIHSQSQIDSESNKHQVKSESDPGQKVPGQISQVKKVTLSQLRLDHRYPQPSC